MFVSNSAFTSDHPIPLAISAGIRLHRPHDLSRRRTPGGSENPISGADVLGETSPLPAGPSPPGRYRVFCRKRPAPESVPREGPRSFSQRYRCMITSVDQTGAARTRNAELQTPNLDSRSDGQPIRNPQVMRITSLKCCKLRRDPKGLLNKSLFPING